MEWKSIWAVDFEYAAAEGDHPRPLCVVAHDLQSGRRLRQWLDGDSAAECPYDTDAESLFLAYYASAEIGCHLQLGWPIPARIIDLCAEFKCATSGLDMPHGRGLTAAMMFYGLRGTFGAEEKKSMQTLAAGGGPYDAAQRQALLDYCESDVVALGRLWPAMVAGIDTPRALIRGRYMAALAQVERCGIPLDAEALQALRKNWETIKPQLISEVDGAYGIYDGETFSMARFEAYLAARGIAWPRTPSGKLETREDTFRDQAKLHPELQELRELRATVSRLKLFDLAVGADGRNRTLLGAFGSKTGRNQPSNTKYIFGPATWVRHLIRPAPGMAIAYIDYSQQEFAAAAALSGDQAMMQAYESGDCYLAFARMAGAVPPDATKKSHETERDRYKRCALAVQYGMQAESLANSIGLPKVYGRDLLNQHKRTFPRFWKWVGDVASTAAARRLLRAPFGWKLNVTAATKGTTLQNWPCQAAGAEMLRLAIIGAVERGIRVCAPVHDALLIEATSEDIEEHVRQTCELMGQASRAVLNGTTVRTDTKIIRYPERYTESRGATIWRRLQALIPELAQKVTPTCALNGHPSPY
jgi:DNA polymerase-1